MNKLELISILKQEANLSKFEAANVVELFFDSMSNAFGWKYGDSVRSM